MQIETEVVEVPWGICDGGLLNGFQSAEPSERKIYSIIADMGQQGYQLVSRRVEKPAKIPFLGRPYALYKTILVFQRIAGW